MFIYILDAFVQSDTLTLFEKILWRDDYSDRYNIEQSDIKAISNPKKTSNSLKKKTNLIGVNCESDFDL